MSQRRERKVWLTPSPRCYSFESRCHGGRFFSLHRRPYLPIGWSPCFPRTIQLPLAASPCGRLSRPRSTTSQSDFRQAIRSSSPCQLVGPYKRCLNLTDLPCSHEILRPHAGGANPGSIPRTLAITHPGILPSPLGNKIGCFNGLISGLQFRSLLFRPTASLSTLRDARYRSPRKTRYPAAS